MLQDSSLAARATLLFCLTPASIFYSAIYTESLFALLSFAGMLCAGRRPWLATAAFALATATRSNGAQDTQATHTCKRSHLTASHWRARGAQLRLSGLCSAGLAV